jgi:hypothetical protein
LTALLAAFARAEIGVRLGGGEPWKACPAAAWEPALHEFDPELGWRNQEGSYAVGPYHPGDPAVRVTMWPRGRRASGLALEERPRRVVIVGCSYTQGWAVSDEETYAWRLQQRFPDVELFNYGTGGYGTLQCLLALERHYAEVGGADAVVFGFGSFQAARNQGEAAWLAALAQGAAREHVWLPWAELDPNGTLVRHGPARYPHWPLCEVSAVVARAQDAWATLRHPERPSGQEELTWRLILELERTAREHGSRFLVASLGWQPDSEAFLERLRSTSASAHPIRYVDCEPPYSESLFVRGEGHPNGALNAIWAERIEPVLRAQLDSAE